MESSVSFCDETTIGGCGYLDIICVGSLLKTGRLFCSADIPGLAECELSHVFTDIVYTKTLTQRQTEYQIRLWGVWSYYLFICGIVCVEFEVVL